MCYIAGARHLRPRTRDHRMQTCSAVKFLRISFPRTKIRQIAAVTVISMIAVAAASVSAQGQAQPSAQASTLPATPPVQLTPYTAQDQSVSAGVPSGWKVLNAAGGSINMAGPQGETINFGDVFLAHEGQFQLGQRGPGAAIMNMPSSAKLSDKLIWFIQQQHALGGKMGAQVKFIYATPMQVPPNQGQCGMFAIDITGIPKPAKGMGVFCSLPPDYAQMFKLVLLMGTAPTATAAQTVPTVAAVYQSYKIAPGWVQKMLAPYDQPPAAAGGQGAGADSAAATAMYLRAMQNSQRVVDHGFRCADAGILGDGSNWTTPRECGGWAPNF
jgi:hypothetical protein